METNTATAEPKPTLKAPLDIKPVGEVKPQEDIITRVTKTELPTDKKSEDKPPIADTLDEAFDYKEIDNIKDPVAKEVFWKAYKSMQRTVSKVTQNVANEKKSLDTIEQDYKRKISEMSTWSPERLKAEMNKADFIASAQTIMGNQTQSNNDNSLLTPEEQARIKNTENELIKLKQMQEQTFAQQQALNIQKQDEEFKSKYANYDPKAIDTITKDMLEGRAQVTREHVYKAYYHDENVKRAYELGRQDERNNIKGRVESASVVTSNGAVTQPSTITKNENESSLSLFRRIGQKNLAEMKVR